MYPLEPFVVNISDGADLRYLKVKIELELPGSTNKADMDLAQSRVRDTVLMLLTAKSLADIRSPEGKVKLREEVMAAITKAAPAIKVDQAYFTDFVVQ
jgi:flagellar FliL protein